MRTNEAENFNVLASALDAYYGVGSGHADTAQVRRKAYEETERRLYSLSVVHDRIEDSKTEITELEELGLDALRHHSASFVSMIKPGMRLSPEEVHEMQLSSLHARLKSDEHEARKMKNALSGIEDDVYYMAVELHYFHSKTDAEIAERLCCDASTVSRNRRRLVRRIAARLYGVNM